MKMTVIGCGYLGAVHAACMASLGHDVVGIDVDRQKVRALCAGKAPFHEPGLEEMLAQETACVSPPSPPRATWPVQASTSSQSVPRSPTTVEPPTSAT